MSAKKATKKPASNRGGKREGAGRKKSPDGPRIQLSLPGRLRGPLEALETATGAKSKSEAVTKLIESTANGKKGGRPRKETKP